MEMIKGAQWPNNSRPWPRPPGAGPFGITLVYKLFKGILSALIHGLRVAAASRQR